MLENIFEDNVFEYNRIKIGDTFSLLCEYYIDPKDNKRKLHPLAVYDQKCKMIGPNLRIEPNHYRLNSKDRYENNNFIAIFDFDAVKNLKNESRPFCSPSKRQDLHIYEVKHISMSFNSMLEFIDHLQNDGIPSRDFGLNSESEDFFIKPRRIKEEKKVNSLLLNKSDFECYGSVYTLRKDKLSLDGFFLEEGVNYENYIDENKQTLSFYKYTKITEQCSIVHTQSEDEICLKEIINYLNSIYKEQNRNSDAKINKKAFSKFLKEMNCQNSAFESLVLKTGFSKDKLIDKVSEIKNYLDSEKTSFSDDLVFKIVKNSEVIRNKFLDEIKLSYQSQLKDIKTAIQREESLLNSSQEEKLNLEKVIKSLKDKKDSLSLFEKNFTNSFENKLDELRKSVPDALASTMLNRSIFGNEKTLPINVEKSDSIILLKDSYLDDKTTIVTKIDKFDILLKCAKNRFSKLNIKIEFSAILFYSMFLCEKLHQNLIICGKYSEQIAHMYSYIVHGAKAAVLDCSNSYEPTVQSNIESLKAKVIVVKYPFESNWIDKLSSISDSSDKFFILVHSFIEDLNIEPSSVYSYFLPIFTNKLIDYSKPKVTISSLWSEVKPTLYELKSENEGDSQISYEDDDSNESLFLSLDQILSKISSNASERYQMLARKIKANDSNMSDNDFLALFIVPFLYATGKLDDQQLEKIFDNEGHLRDLKEILGSYND